jgi:hypothetical protein
VVADGYAMSREWGEVSPAKVAQSNAAGRVPFLQVWFRCAGAYMRVHRSRDGTRYVARCPRCGEAVRFVVGQGGTPQRQFEVSCGR